MDIAEVVGMWAFMASWFTPTILFCVLNLMIGTIFISSNYKTPNKPPPPPAAADDEEQYNPPQLARASSIVDRFKSLNFSLYRSEQPETHHYDPPHDEQQQQYPGDEQEEEEEEEQQQQQQYPEDEQEQEQEQEDEHNHPPQLVRAPSLLGRVSSFDFSFFRSERPDPPREEAPQRQSSRDHHVKRIKSDKTGEGPPPARLAPAKMRRSASEKLGKEEAAAEEEDVEEIDRRRPATVRERNTTAMYVEDQEVDSKADDFIDKFKKQLKLQRLDSVRRFSEMLNRGT